MFFFHTFVDAQDDLIPWDYPDDSSDDLIIEERSILLDRSVTVGSLIIRNGGKLIFKDFGEDNNVVVTLRAKSVQIVSDGELWIGSRSCRYQGSFFKCPIHKNNSIRHLMISKYPTRERFLLTNKIQYLMISFVKDII